MSNKPTLREGTSTWDAIRKCRCYCGHVMTNHQRWASKIVCLESTCHKQRPEDVPDDLVAVRECWDFEETNDAE